MASHFGRTLGAPWRNLILAPIAATGALAGGAGVAAAGGGGVGVPDPPKVGVVSCVNKCAGLYKATVGSVVQAGGHDLANVTLVKFPERGGGRIAVEPSAVSSTRVKAVVPRRSTSGPLVVRDDYGRSDTTSNALRVVDESQIQPSAGFDLADASVRPGKSFFLGRPRTTLDYLFESEQALDIRIQVIRRRTGALVDTFVRRDQKPFAPHSATWNGLASDGDVAPNGRYKFKVGPVSGGGDDGDGATRFQHYNHKFPVRGPHTYGDGLGAGRGHQGQDVFADCGTRLEAARGGRVEWKAYHSAAGYYVVIDGRRTSIDYVYMHLVRPAVVGSGERVRTGEKIGTVGESGNASGCHLHFEAWRGWRERLLDPTPRLRRWDSWS